MVGHVGEGDTRRNGGRAAKGGKQRGLADAVADTRIQDTRCTVDFGIGIVEIGVVTDLARREIEAPHRLGGRHIRCHGPGGKRLDRRMVAIDVFGRRQIDGVLFAFQDVLRFWRADQAGAARNTGFSSIGRLITADNMPRATASHHTIS